MKSVSTPELLCWFCVLSALIGRSAAQEPPPLKPADHSEGKLRASLAATKPLRVDPKDDELRKLLKARYNEALGELKDLYEAEELASKYAVTRRDEPDDLYGPWKRLVQAGLDVYHQPVDKIGLLTQYLEVTKQREKIEQERYNYGRIRVDRLHRARYERLDAEIRLFRLKEATNGKGK